MTNIRFTLGSAQLTATLADSPTVRDLADQLPLELTFADLHEVEKIAPLPRPLDLTDAPVGAAPGRGDIGYYAPLGNLVLYYAEVGYWEGIVPLGRFDGEVGAVESPPDDSRVRIERA